eukprot:scaffold4934_cov128-Isochrysis_galbana.AAC.1
MGRRAAECRLGSSCPPGGIAEWLTGRAQQPSRLPTVLIAPLAPAVCARTCEKPSSPSYGPSLSTASRTRASESSRPAYALDSDGRVPASAAFHHPSGTGPAPITAARPSPAASAPHPAPASPSVPPSVLSCALDVVRKSALAACGASRKVNSHRFMALRNEPVRWRNVSALWPYPCRQRKRIQRVEPSCAPSRPPSTVASVEIRTDPVFWVGSCAGCALVECGRPMAHWKALSKGFPMVPGAERLGSVSMHCEWARMPVVFRLSGRPGVFWRVWLSVVL